MKLPILVIFTFVFLLGGCTEKTGGAALNGLGADGLGLEPGDDPSIGNVDQIDEDNGISTDPSEQVGFRIEPGLYQLEDGEGVLWDGCGENQFVGGGFQSDTECGKAFLHPRFATHLETHFKNCIETSASAAGLAAPFEVYLRHRGTYEKREGNDRLNLHSYARAIDIESFQLISATGGAISISAHVDDYQSPTSDFYDSFRRCWADTMPDACVPGQEEYRGSVGHLESELGGNSRQSDNLQLSLPFCADE